MTEVQEMNCINRSPQLVSNLCVLWLGAMKATENNQQLTRETPRIKAHCTL